MYLDTWYVTDLNETLWWRCNKCKITGTSKQGYNIHIECEGD
jgi:hypothetical protein